MRISTGMYQQASLNAILDKQVELSHTQQQLASGKRILTPADDPISSASLVDISQSLAVYEQFNDNADQAEMRLNQEETVLKSVGNALHRARELAVQGNNDTYSAEQRKDIATEIRQILGEVMTLANSTDGNNNYLFSGTMSNTMPFTQLEAGAGLHSTFTYEGDQGQRRLQIGPQRTVADTDSGYEVFNKVRIPPPMEAEIGPLSGFNFSAPSEASFQIDGSPVVLNADYGDIDGLANAIELQMNGDPLDPAYDPQYTVSQNGDSVVISRSDGSQPVMVDGADAGALAAGIQNTRSMMSVFETIDRLAVGLETNDMSEEHIGEVDAALQHVVGFQASIGSRLNSIDRQRVVNNDFVFQMTNIRSEMEDVDYASTISKMNQQLVGMQAAQQTFTKVQNLSLFNYL